MLIRLPAALRRFMVDRVWPNTLDGLITFGTAIYPQCGLPPLNPLAAAEPAPPRVLTGPPAGHPERVPDRPLSAVERALWSELELRGPAP
jgi:hypothetical protein